MKNELFYFSGTGNTLLLAKELQKRISNTQLTPIVSVIDKKVIKSNASVIGILFPIYAFTTPRVVENFLSRTEFSFDSYIFALSSRLCSAAVLKKVNRKLNSSQLNAGFSVEMGQNYLFLFKPPDQNEIQSLHKKMRTSLDSICKIITSRQTHFKKDDLLLSFVAHTLFPLISYLYRKTRFFHMEEKFWVNEACNGCGICESVCLSNKIDFKDNKPIWKDSISCYNCLACLHHCPVNAIQIGKKTIDKKRYTNPEINYEEIAAEKNAKMSDYNDDKLK